MASSKKVVVAALVGNGMIAATKFGAALFTGSSAMFSEAIHSVADTGNQALMLWGMRAAKRPPDEDHPFGYGKEIYFWSFVVAILLFAIGAGVSLYEGIRHMAHAIEHGGHLEHEASFTVNYVVLGAAFLFECGALYIAVREFNKTRGDEGFLEAVRTGKDPSMFVVLFEDIGAGTGLVIAFVGVVLTDITGLAYYDAGSSICIGLLLGATALWMAYETKGLLIGESAKDSVVEGIRNLLGEYDEIRHINEVVTIHMGPNTVLATISVDYRDGLKSGAIEKGVTEITRRIKNRYPRIKRVFVEGEAMEIHDHDEATDETK